MTALSVLAVFLGIFAAFVVATPFFGPDSVERRFGFLLETPTEQSIVTQSWGPPLPLLGHNLLVLGSGVVLGLVYRSFGVLIVLAWNAASWGLVLPFLVDRALHSGEHQPVVLIAASLVGVLPHLILEALAYVTAGLAAVFGSNQLTTTDATGAGVSAKRVAKSCAIMLAIASVLLAAAAMLESYWTPFVLGAL
jgi:hypothetical protein